MTTPVSHVLARFDFKYGPKDWRSEETESFQKTREIQTDNTVVDGQIVRTVETTWSYADAIAGVPADIIAGPPYLFADGTYRKDVAFTFQKIRIRTSTFEAFGEAAYQVTIDDYDVLAEKHTITVSVIDGKIPLAPTVKSALSNLVQRPILGVLDATCDYVDTKEGISVIYAQNDEDAARVAKRRMQRATAIQRNLDLPANPLIKVGHTVRIVDAKRSLDARHMVVGRSISRDENGRAKGHLECEFWTK